MKKFNVFKTVFTGSGKTFYSVSEQCNTTTSFKSKMISIAENNVGKGKPSTKYQKDIFELSDRYTELDVVLCGSFLTKEEATTCKLSLIESDLSNTNVLSNHPNRTDVVKTEIRIPRESSMLVGGVVYVTELSILKNKDISRGFLDYSSKINHPTKGAMIKVTANNVIRF